MSTLKTTYIEHPSATDPALTLTSAGDVLGPGGQSLAPSGRNLIYNGAMQVHQRGTSTSSITASGFYTADRWDYAVSIGTWTESVENDAPTGSGFRKSLKLLCTTANAAPGASNVAVIRQRLEGQDLQRIKKGTSSAEKLTLSFWVKSNVTGTFIARLEDFNNTRGVSASYSVSSSGVWEKKVITFPEDTTGAFTNDNNRSLDVLFYLGAGSNQTSGTLATTWAAIPSPPVNNAVGQVNVGAATNNYWQITGVQLEVGPVATPFEFEDYGTTLRKCQRYYYRKDTNSNYSPFGLSHLVESVNICYFSINIPVQMRVAPTSFTKSNIASVQVGTGVGGSTTDNWTLTPDSTKDTGVVYQTAAGAFTTSNMYFVRANNSSSAFVAFSAEL